MFSAFLHGPSFFHLYLSILFFLTILGKSPYIMIVIDFFILIIFIYNGSGHTLVQIRGLFVGISSPHLTYGPDNCQLWQQASLHPEWTFLTTYYFSITISAFIPKFAHADLKMTIELKFHIFLPLLPQRWDTGVHHLPFLVYCLW